MFRVLILLSILIPALASGQAGRSLSAERDLEHYFSLYSQADGKLAPSINALREHLVRLDQKRSSFKSGKAFRRSPGRRGRGRLGEIVPQAPQHIAAVHRR